MLLLIPTFLIFTITIFLTSYFFLLLLLHHYRPHCIHLSYSFLSLQWLDLSNWVEPPRRRPHLAGYSDNMTLKGAASQACAACKYQRRKCTPECPLAPFFPPDQPKMFLNAHKLFGVCNILKILNSVDPCLKFETMKSIIYQANIRDKFPVYGCWEVVWQLQYQIMVAEQELQNVHKQIALYRQHHYHHQQPQISAMPDYVTSQLELGMAPPNNNNNTISLLNHSTPQPYNDNNAIPVTQQQQQHYSNRSVDDAYTSAYDIDSKENITAANALWAQNPFANNNSSINDSNNNAGTVQSELGVSQPLAIEPEDVQDYDELHPFFDTIDDRQSYIDSKEAYDSSSSDESFKDTTQSSIEHAAENALKSAAACFSLTGVKLSVS